MTASMLNGSRDVVGSLTSGGTESILMAIKTYRDRARALHPKIKHPEIIAPMTIHPAFEKAAHYFDVKVVHIPITNDYTPNMHLYKKAINSNTILLLASAPQYCHGVMDPIEEISELAIQYNLPFHVDSCFGGFMLPWVEKLGYPIPCKYDFRLKGVTSISADLHKYGYSPKGSSVILYRDDSIRFYQYFAYSSWPGGLFGSPSMSGTRPGGNIAISYATLLSVGQSGYLQMAKELMEITKKLIDGINSIESLTVLGKPCMTCFSFGSSTLNERDSNKLKTKPIEILAVADIMEEKGWKMERQQNPNSIHATIMPHHVRNYQNFLTDLAASVEFVRQNDQLAKKGTAQMYGAVGMIPDKAIVDDFVVNFFSEIYKVK